MAPAFWTLLFLVLLALWVGRAKICYVCAQILLLRRGLRAEFAHELTETVTPTQGSPESVSVESR